MSNNNHYKVPVGIGLWLLLITFIFSIPFIPLTLDKKVDVAFLDQEGNENALVFFGFTSCGDICPMTLSILKQLYDEQEISSKWPQVIFVDIDINSNTIEASNFAKQFHDSFIGVHISNEALLEMSAKFGLNIKQEGSQITHLGKTYLLRRKLTEWRLVKVYNPNSMSVEILQKELRNLNN